MGAFAAGRIAVRKYGSLLEFASSKSSLILSGSKLSIATRLSLLRRHGLILPSEVTLSRVQWAQNSVLSMGLTTSTSAPSRKYFFRLCISRVRMTSALAARLLDSLDISGGPQVPKVHELNQLQYQAPLAAELDHLRDLRLVFLQNHKIQLDGQ